MAMVNIGLQFLMAAYRRLGGFAVKAGWLGKWSAAAAVLHS